MATYGRFFADVMVRGEFYNISQTDFSVGAFGQRFDAHGVSVSTSAGTIFRCPTTGSSSRPEGSSGPRRMLTLSILAAGRPSAVSDWFRRSRPPRSTAIGQLSLRAGTTLTSDNMIWQPFASASVFSEFAAT